MPVLCRERRATSAVVSAHSAPGSMKDGVGQRLVGRPVTKYLDFAGLGSRLQSCIAKEQKDALDNLYHSVGVLGVGNGNFLYCRWADSHSVSHWLSRAG